MTILSILSKDEIRLFEKPPQFSTEERHYFFTLPAWAEEELLKIQTPINKVGFILQFGYFHATKKFYPKSFFPETDGQFVSKGVGLKYSISINDYANTTLQRHRKIILEKLGYHAFSKEYAQLLASEADFLFSKQVRLKEVFESLLLLLEKKRVEVPTYNILAHIITHSFRKYQKEIVSRIEKILTEGNMVLLDTLLAVDETYETTEKQRLKLKRYKITLLKETDQAVRPSRIQENLAHLHVLKDYFQKLQPAIQELQISDETIRYYATIAIKAQIPQIARRGNEKYIYLLAFIAHQYYSFQDALTDMLLRAVQNSMNKAEEAQKQVLREQHITRSVAVEHLLTNYLTKRDLITHIEQILAAPEFTDSDKIAAVQKLILSQQQTTEQTKKGEEVVTLLQRAYGKKR